MPEMKRVARDRNYGSLRNYLLDRDTTPIIEVELGERFVIETEDAFNGMLREDPSRLHPRDTAPYSQHVPGWHNPVCGPIYVKGVEPGDVLVVSIHEITGIQDGATATLPESHHFAGLRGWEDCDEMFSSIILNSNGQATWRYGAHEFGWSLKPFLGTIATAPEFEKLSTVPTSFGSAPAGGGNMDCRDVRVGSKIFLQSWNPGGLLFVGDVHGSQGDGEVTGVANEVAAEVTLSCDVLRKKQLRNVRIETPESLVSVYCYRPMEEAFRLALKDLILWLEEDYGMEKREAYILASIHPEFRLNAYQVCTGLGRIMTTCGAEMPKAALP